MQKSLYFAVKTYITEGHICHCGYNEPEQRATAPSYIRTNADTNDHLHCAVKKSTTTVSP